MRAMKKAVRRLYWLTLTSGTVMLFQLPGCQPLTVNQEGVRNVGEQFVSGFFQGLVLTMVELFLV